MGSEDIRAPILWRRPHAKIYSYNQEFGGNYYQVNHLVVIRSFSNKLLLLQPMIDYVDAKERQGIFFEKPTERIHLPDPAEQCMKKHESG